MQNQQPPIQTGSEINKKTVKRWPKTLARVLLYLVVVVCIFFVGAFLSLQTRPVRDAVTRIITKAIEQNTRAVCRIAELSGNLFSRFEIKGVELKDSSTGVSLMSADRIDVSYSIPMLLGRVLWINRLTIDGLSVNLFQAKDGKWNFEMLTPEYPPESMPEPPTATAESSNYKVRIKRLMIGNSDITLSQYAGMEEIIRHFKKIECQAELDVGKDISVKITQLAVRLDKPMVDLRDLSGDIRYDFGKRRVDFKDVRIKGRKSDFTVNGLLRFPAHGPDMVNMDLRAAIKALSLGEFGQAFPIQMPDEDIVSGNITVSGPVSKMNCRLDLRMDTCRVESQGLVTIDEDSNVGLDITGETSSLDLSALPVLNLKSFSGNLNTDFSLFWQKIGSPDQTGRITMDLTSSRLWDYLIDKAKLDVGISGADFIFKNLVLNTPYGKLVGSGSLAGIMSSEKDNQIQFTADIEGLNPENLVKNNRYAGNINGNVSASIFIPKTFAVEGITADATGRTNPSRMMGMDIQSTDFEAVWRDEKVTIKRFDMETGLGTAALTGRASIKDKSCQLKAAANLPDIKLIKPFIPDMTDDEALSGSVAVTAEISGNWKEPDVTVVLNGKKVVIRQVSTDSLSAEGDWRGDLKAFNMTGKCSANNIRVNGLQISVMDLTTTVTPATIQADLHLQGAQKEEFLLSGNISNWTEPVKTVDIEKMTLVSFNQPPLVNREPIKLSISRDRILVDLLHLDSGNASLVLKGETGFNPSAVVSADVTLRDFNLKRISGFWEGGEKIFGRLSSEIRLSGVLGNPVISMTTSVNNFSYDGSPETDMSVALEYKDPKIDITGSGLRQGRTLMDVNGSASMRLSLYPFAFIPRPESLFVTMNLDQVDISEISGLFSIKDPLQGFLSSRIILSGRLESPNIDANLSIKDVVYDKYSLSKTMASVKYSDSRAQMTASAYRQTTKLVDVNGSALMTLSFYPFKFVPKPGGLDLTMKLDQVDISWISDIINDPEYDVSGIVDATASVSGDFFKPIVQGRMQLSNGALNLKKQALIYETLTADLKFAEKEITIEALNVKGDKEGSLNLSGVLTHENLKLQTFNIRAVGDKFYIPFHAGVDAKINPDLTLSGTWEAPVLSGKIKVPEGRVNLERFLEKKFSEIQIVALERTENGVLQLPEKEPEPLEFVDPLTADVAVIIPNNFWFKGKDEFIEIKGNVQLKKDSKKPFVLYGSVMPVRGTYRFRGRLFQIKQGEIAFAGQEDINPSVNIEADTVIGDVKIIIRLTGSFARLNLILDSEPVMDQSAIISYLIFGRGPNDLSEKESFQAEEAALSFTGQIAADKLRDIIGDSLGIDSLNISAGNGGLRQGSLTMGKYVLPKVFVTFRQGFDETVTQKVEVTYEINKNFDLETQIDNEQTSALDLIWKYEY